MEDHQSHVCNGKVYMQCVILIKRNEWRKEIKLHGNSHTARGIGSKGYRELMIRENSYVTEET